LLPSEDQLPIKDSTGHVVHTPHVLCCCSSLMMTAQQRIQPKRVRQGKCYLYVQQHDGTVYRVCVLRLLAATSEQYEVSMARCVSSLCVLKGVFY